MSDLTPSGGTFCPDCLTQAGALGLGPEGCVVYDSLDGPINKDGTRHRHCEICGEEAIGYTRRQVEERGITHLPKGGWVHVLDDEDCPGSWGYDVEGTPFWRSQRTELNCD